MIRVLASSGRFLTLSVWGVFGMLFPSVASAAVVVTEIMYNPLGANTGHQWVEVTNTGADSVDLSAKDIRFFDASGNHVLKAYGSGGTILTTGESAVLAQNPLTFLSDYPTYAGLLLKASYALTASGILGLMQTDGTVLAKVSYSSAEGAKGDGNSLQRTEDGGFVPGAPTPGSFPRTPPPALQAPVKQITTSKSSTSQGKKTVRTTSAKTTKSVTSKKYAKGTLAPADSANAASAGALFGAGGLPSFSFTLPSFSIPYKSLLQSVFSSPWFAGFLALLGFSSFSLLMIQRDYHI